MKIWAWLSFTACGISLLLCGCGGGSTPAAVSPLAGNWLLVGPMPTNGISFPPPPMSSGVRLAMTFDVVGDQVIAGVFGSNYCDNVQASFTFGGVAAGILAADGSFTATPKTLLTRYQSRERLQKEGESPGPAVTRCLWAAHLRLPAMRIFQEHSQQPHFHW